MWTWTHAQALPTGPIWSVVSSLIHIPSLTHKYYTEHTRITSTADFFQHNLVLVYRGCITSRTLTKVPAHWSASDASDESEYLYWLSTVHGISGDGLRGFVWLQAADKQPTSAVLKKKNRYYVLVTWGRTKEENKVLPIPTLWATWNCCRPLHTGMVSPGQLSEYGVCSQVIYVGGACSFRCPTPTILCM
jgi:hypothetical protein